MTKNIHKVSFASLLVTLGIVFGDIGTSPLYVFTAITKGNNFDPELIYGSLSCIVWTLFLIATLKYVFLALNADNQGEGGIFSLYALLRKTKKPKWIIYPTLIGCATLISDGFITPAISISSAVEGLALTHEGFPTLPVVCGIIIALFAIQQFGTKSIGRFFGPIMLMWFILIGILGLRHLWANPQVLMAINPMYAVRFIVEYPSALWILGAVFLCTTGAEALYADLGHCGKKNIRISWGFVLSMLLLSYFGQAAFCLSQGPGFKTDSVFYASVPEPMLLVTITIATVAAIIASQALISGIFTLVSEAIKLKLWTNLRIRYPSTMKGQVYIPLINSFLMVGCLIVVLLFKKSIYMEAAYGLAITIDMLMTSLLLGYLMVLRAKKGWIPVALLFVLFVTIEGIFLISNTDKIVHGGWFTLLVSLLLSVLLVFHHTAKKIRNRVAEYIRFDQITPMLQDVSNDKDIPYLATHLVYPTRSSRSDLIDTTIVHSLFQMKPKRALVYWFVHIDITNEPYGIQYKSQMLIPKKSYYIHFKIGFKEPHLMDNMMRSVYQDMISSGELDKGKAFKSLEKYNTPADFKYVLINSRVATDNHLSVFEMLSVRVYRFLKSMGLSAIEDFGLDSSNSLEERIPINVAPREKISVIKMLKK